MLGHAIAVLLCAAGSAQGICPGDCNGDGVISPGEVEETVHAVFDAARCPAADADGSGSVTVADLLRVRSASVDPPAGCRSIPPTPASTWIPLTPLPGGGRQEVGVTALGNLVFVIGGLTTSGKGSARVDTYDARRGTWARVDDLPRALHHVGAAVAAGLVFSVGGFIGQSFAPADDTLCYDVPQNAWIAVTPLPAPRGALALAAQDDVLHAIGGSGVSGSLADHTVYDPFTRVWRARAPLPSPRNHLAAVSLDGYVYAIGGRSDGSGNANSGELDRYDPVTDTWDVLAPMPTARSGHAAAVLNGRIVTMGGEVNANNPPTGVFVNVEIYDPATDTWIAIDPMPVPRHGIGAATDGDLIYVPGGATRAGFAATDRVDALRITW
jgi:hypothetical protein